MAFALPQEVSRHVRESACVFRTDEVKSDTPSGEKQVSEKEAVPSASADVSSKDEEGGESTSVACSQCSYSTDSRAELLFHEVLHGESITDSSGTDTGLGTTTSQTQVRRVTHLQIHFLLQPCLEWLLVDLTVL
jgi:hypothetical protein